MAMYKVQLKKAPEKFIRRQNRKVQNQIISAIRKLEKNPRPEQAKKLAAMTDLYRMRTGDYRVVYTIQNKKLIVLVVRISHRKDVYSRL